MYAVVVTVAISDHEVAENHLREHVVPGVSQAPGFVAGYWTRKDESGLGMVVFESRGRRPGYEREGPVDGP